MGQTTGISWTDHTFNPWWGCVKVSPLCDHCYAETLDKRVGGSHWGPNGPRRYVQSSWNDVHKWNKAAEKAGVRRRVFCASMCDIMEKTMPVISNKGEPMPFDTGELRRRACEEIVPACPWLDFQFLTKRIGNVPAFVPSSWMNGEWPANVWMGASIGTQAEADRDLPKLKAIPAAVRFVSMEPLLESVMTDFSGIQWVIVGCESGHGRRRTESHWLHSLKTIAMIAGSAFFVKQLDVCGQVSTDANEFPDGLRVQEFPESSVLVKGGAE